MKRFVIFGTGAVAQNLMRVLDFTQVEVVAFVNSKKEMGKIGWGGARNILF